MLQYDPNEEEAKGGSAPVGKMLLSSGDKQLVLLCYVPDDKIEKVNASEWMKATLLVVGGEFISVPAVPTPPCLPRLNPVCPHFTSPAHLDTSHSHTHTFPFFLANEVSSAPCEAERPGANTRVVVTRNLLLLITCGCRLFSVTGVAGGTALVTCLNASVLITWRPYMLLDLRHKKTCG